MGIIKGKFGVYTNGDFGIRRGMCEKCKLYNPDDKECSLGIYKHWTEDCVKVKLLDDVKEYYKKEHKPHYTRYTTQGVAKVLGLSESTIRKYTKNGMGCSKDSKDASVGYKWTISVNIYNLYEVKEWLIQNHMEDRASRIDSHIEKRNKQFEEYLQLL